MDVQRVYYQKKTLKIGITNSKKPIFDVFDANICIFKYVTFQPLVYHYEWEMGRTIKNTSKLESPTQK